MLQTFEKEQKKAFNKLQTKKYFGKNFKRIRKSNLGNVLFISYFITTAHTIIILQFLELT